LKQKEERRASADKVGSTSLIPDVSRIYRKEKKKTEEGRKRN